ncbi:triose-phosphate isomerase [Sphingomonas nostoxanthinifaciens]|uniref:triose-phosphate isomerase n=1 Tax=Sphingomonas nostoxanthinifaciens TaxID=2872652 RepID=UPI001CC1E264|nr:triose-phosphate isomerase [Sphingomonas nostoxanthinifaciens]UAK25317.1 triose-phosphate isomerase [Sphingomonas nostoxanthinifaciens]
MSLRKLVAGNWKMNGLRISLGELAPIGRAATAAKRIDVAICPPFTLVAQAAANADGIAIGGQDCHFATTGAYTGYISADMLTDAGASHVIVGHSERRSANHETDADVRAKAEAAMEAGLVAILCIGETDKQRDAGRAGLAVASQLDGSLPRTATGDTLIIAYEPRWAIGTGRTPSSGEIGEMHKLIRAKLIDILGTEGVRVRILYGGSVTSHNAAEFLSVPDVDGALVGGASLTAAQFVPIIEAAENVSQ